MKRKLGWIAEFGGEDGIQCINTGLLKDCLPFLLRLHYRSRDIQLEHQIHAVCECLGCSSEHVDAVLAFKRLPIKSAMERLRIPK